MSPAKVNRYRLAYFGWSIEFSSPPATAEELRAKGNALVIADHGTEPKGLGYIQPGVPFPAYVPVEMWDAETELFYPLT